MKLRLILTLMLAGLGACVTAVEPSDLETAEPTAEAADDLYIGMPCGRGICARGLSCCNASCGICAPVGGTCSQEVCEPPESPIHEPCGDNACGPGTYCCNSSCGICMPIGGFCTQQFCAPDQGSAWSSAPVQ